MLLWSSRAGRLPLALRVAALAALTVASIAGLSACADGERPITAPNGPPTKPSLAVGDVVTVTTNRGGTDVGSLRWAVAQTTGGEVIRFDARLAGSTITLDSTLVIPNAITIEGPADKGITISGGGRQRVIDILFSANAQGSTTLRNLSVTGGKLTVDGGAGIRTSSRLVLEHATVWGNESPGAAAILANAYAPLTLTNSTVSGNTATLLDGFAIRAYDQVSVTHSTIAYNAQGGIHFSEYHEGVLTSSIIAHNGRFNCFVIDLVRYNGTNISDNLSCGDSAVMVIADAKLAALRDNGGPSPTHALLADSPAFNGAGPCGLAVDQRYTPRGASCDIGAFEATDLTTLTLALDRVANVNPAGTALVAGTLQCGRLDPQPVRLHVKLQQKWPDKTVVEGYGDAYVTCDSTTERWAATVVPSGGTFTKGNAAVTATVVDGPAWVTPATASRSIKLAESIS